MTEFLGNMYSWFTFIPKITLSNLFEILILTVLIYEVLLWVKSTRAGVLLRGGMIIVGFYLLAACLLYTSAGLNEKVCCKLACISTFSSKSAYGGTTKLLVFMNMKTRRCNG